MKNFPESQHISWSKIKGLLKKDFSSNVLKDFALLLEKPVYKAIKKELYSEGQNYVEDFSFKQSDWQAICNDLYKVEKERHELGKINETKNPYFYYRDSSIDLKKIIREYFSICGIQRSKKFKDLHGKVIVLDHLSDISQETDEIVLLKHGNLLDETKEIIRNIINEISKNEYQKFILNFCITDRNSPKEFYMNAENEVRFGYKYENCRKMVLNVKKKHITKALNIALAKKIPNEKIRNSFIKVFLQS